MPRDLDNIAGGKRAPPRGYPEPEAITIGLAALFAAALVLTELGIVGAKAALAFGTVVALASGLLALAGSAKSSLRRKAEADTSMTTNADRAMSPSTIVAAIPDPALLLDQSTIVHHNGAAEKLFGKPLAGLALEHVSRDPELLNAVESAKSLGEPKSARFEQFSGVERHLVATASPVGVLGAQNDLVLVIIRDLSDQHRMLEMRTDFIANASHELRTPLASVRGFIETLQGSAKNDEAARARFLGIMAQQAERMTRLIDDLLLLSRVEETAYLPATGRVDLDEVLTDVVRTLLPIAGDRKISIVLPRYERPIVVTGERDELFQVFQNLIENAVKYGRDGGRVAIARNLAAHVVGHPPRVVVTIEDDGPGIAPEHLPRLTERFYRVNADESRKIGGTGLGLAIVKHVLNRHRGEVQFASQVGVGTSVRVLLPITEK